MLQLCNAIALECAWALCRVQTIQRDGEEQRRQWMGDVGEDLLDKIAGDVFFAHGLASLCFPRAVTCPNGCCDKMLFGDTIMITTPNLLIHGEAKAVLAVTGDLKQRAIGLDIENVLSKLAKGLSPFEDDDDKPNYIN